MRNENVSNVAPIDPYKDMEFETFIELIGNNVRYWSHMAQVLRVSRKTIERWRKHPLAIKAIQEETVRCLDGMEQAGKDDWRMHREKLSMLGILTANKQQVQIESTDEDINALLDSLERKPSPDHAAIAREIEAELLKTQYLVDNPEIY